MNTLNTTSDCHVTRKWLSRPIFLHENGIISRTVGARNTIARPIPTKSTPLYPTNLLNAASGCHVTRK